MKKVILDLGYSNVDMDLDASLKVDSNNKQNVLETVNNYIKMLTRATNVLTIVRDAISDDEKYSVELVAEIDNLIAMGDPQIIDRFVGFGIADYYEASDDESDIYSESEEGSESESYSNSDSETQSESINESSDNSN